MDICEALCDIACKKDIQMKFDLTKDIQMKFDLTKYRAHCLGQRQTYIIVITARQNLSEIKTQRQTDKYAKTSTQTHTNFRYGVMFAKGIHSLSTSRVRHVRNYQNSP